MREGLSRFWLPTLLLPAALACRGEVVTAPAASAPVPAASAARVEAPRAASANPKAQPSASFPVAPAASEPAQAAASADVEEPPLLAPDGSPLPQTEDRPSANSERFKRRMKLVPDSILAGDAEPGRAAFFPLIAYAQVKDVQKPERDYRYRLMANFERDVRAYRKLLGKDAASAEFLGVEVPEEQAQWMKPGKEGNRVGYFRVLRSKLRFRLASGSERSLELTSMISWRGEWYVVHLHGFK